MKQILLFLLISTSIFAQNPTKFEKVRITSNTTSTTATKVNVQEADGTVNTITKSDLIEYLEYASAVNLPVTGLEGKIYLTLDNNTLYRWNGTIYTPITADISGKENISNKQNSLASDGTNTKYPTVTAVNTGLGLKENSVNKNTANGYAGLGSDGKLISSQLPSITISDTFVVGSQSAMLAVTAETGDVAVRTDLNKSFILKGTNSTVLADWQELLTPTSAVTKVFGRNGAVSAQSGDYNADQITETVTRVFQTPTQRTNNDATSSIQTQLNGKVNLSASETIGGVKTFSNMPILSAATNVNGQIIYADASKQLKTTTTFKYNDATGVLTTSLGNLGTNAYTSTAYLPLSGNSTVNGIINTNGFKLGGTDQISWGGGFNSGKPLIEGSVAGLNIYPKGNLNDGILNVVGSATFASSVTANGQLIIQNQSSDTQAVFGDGIRDIKIDGKTALGQSNLLKLSAVSGGNQLGIYDDKIILSTTGLATFSSLSGTGTRTVVASSTGQLSAVSNIDYRNYKVYTALLTQSGTSAPVATVLENTLGAITLNYTSAGSFTATSSSLFTLNKTSIFTQELFGLDSKSFQQVTSASNINLYTSSGGSYISGLYNNTLIEIRVYN